MDKLKFDLMSPCDEGEYWAVHYNYTDTLGTRILVNGKELVALVNEAMGETANSENIERDIALYYGVEEQFGTLADYLYMRGYSDDLIEETVKEYNEWIF